MTPQDIITTARDILSDTAIPYRYSDVDMLSYVNTTLKTISSHRPDVFSYTTAVLTTDDTVVQQLPADAIRLVEVFYVVGGNALTEVNRETMDQMYPQWVSDPAGTPVNYVRHPRNPTSYFLYPRPSAALAVIAEYVRAPIDYILSDQIDITPDMFAMAVCGTVSMVEAVDVEAGNAERTKLFRDLFIDGIGASVNLRAVADMENAAINKLR